MVATCGGAFLGLAPLVGLIGAAVWLVVVALTRYASVSSIVAAVSLPVGGAARRAVARARISIAAALGVLLLHSGNLARLRAGTEPRVRLSRRRPAQA
jgi:acyl phosphate:glycerol-3-phosphate acyltransferase